MKKFSYIKSLKTHKHPLFLIFCIFIIIFVAILNPFHPYSVKVSIDTLDLKKDIIKIYYRDQNNGYSEERVAYNTKLLKWVNIPRTEDIIRIDPMSRKCRFKINSIFLRKKSIFRTEYLSLDMCNLSEIFKLESLELEGGDQCIWKSKSIDPFFYDFKIPENWKNFAEINNLLYESTANFSLGVFCLTFAAVIFLLLYLLTKFVADSPNSNLYIISYIFFLFLGVIFATNIPKNLPPDEIAHMSYIQYMTASKSVYPEKEKMHINNNESDAYNYLSHPPMYYFIMAKLSMWLSNDFESGSYFLFIRLLNTLLFSVNLLLVFSVTTNFRWRNETHILFIAVLFSIPSFIVFCNTINNDNIGILSGALLLFSVFFHQIKGEDIYLQFIILSVAIAFFSKLTAALLVVIFVMMYLVFYKKHIFQSDTLLKSLKTPFFYFVTFLLLFSLSFFAYYKIKYGSVIPSLQSISMEAYKSSGFYIPLEHINILSFSSYKDVFFGLRLWPSLNGILAHGALNITFREHFRLEYFVLAGAVSFFLIPKNYKEKNRFFIMLGLMSIIVFMGIHFYMCFSSHRLTGYTGGVQARYYFPFLFFYIIAFCSQIDSFSSYLACKSCFLFKIVRLLVVGISFYAFYLYSKVVCHILQACF